jgi:hypothetical protein
VSADVLAQVEAEIAEFNMRFFMKKQYTLSSWLNAAIREKLAHATRSRQQKPRGKRKMDFASPRSCLKQVLAMKAEAHIETTTFATTEKSSRSTAGRSRMTYPMKRTAAI